MISQPIMLSSWCLVIGVSELCELADALSIVDVFDSCGDCDVLVKQVHKVSAVALELCVCYVGRITLGYELSNPKDTIEIEFTLQSKCATFKVVFIGDVYFVAFKVAPSVRQALEQVVAEPVDCFGIKNWELDNNVVVRTLGGIDTNLIVVNLWCVVAISDKAWWVHKAVESVVRDCVLCGLDTTVIASKQDVVDSVGFGVKERDKGFVVTSISHWSSVGWG